MFRPKQRSCETVRVFPRVAWACHLIASFLFLASTALAASPTKLGDLNADGILDVFDLTVLRQHIRQTTPLPENLRPFADLNGDGFLNDPDAIPSTDAALLGYGSVFAFPPLVIKLDAADAVPTTDGAAFGYGTSIAFPPIRIQLPAQ